MIIIFAPIFFISETVTTSLGITLGQFLAAMIMAWVIYSTFELISYFWLGIEATEIFYGAMISLIGIIIVLYHIPSIWSSESIPNLFSLYYALPFLLISSILAAVGSFKLGGVFSEY